MSEYDEDFTRLSELRMQAGLQEYRGGDASLPFLGDPVQCGMEEALDMRNYALHALQRDELTAYEAGEVIDHARQAFRILWLSNRHRNRV